MKNLIDFLKKGALSLAIPLMMTSCSITKNIDNGDPLYYRPSKDKEIATIVKKDNISNADTLILETEMINDQLVDNMKFVQRLRQYPYPYFYRSHIDSDFDGITNFNDPWPYKFGPYIDMNGNGFIDWRDIQISDWDLNIYTCMDESAFWWGSDFYFGMYDHFFFDWEFYGMPYWHHRHNPLPSPLPPTHPPSYTPGNTRTSSGDNRRIETVRDRPRYEKPATRTIDENRRVNRNATEKENTYQYNKPVRRYQDNTREYVKPNETQRRQSVEPSTPNRVQPANQQQQTIRRSSGSSGSNSSNNNSSGSRRR
jgi:hypothetical protein